MLLSQATIHITELAVCHTVGVSLMRYELCEEEAGGPVGQSLASVAEQLRP